MAMPGKDELEALTKILPNISLYQVLKLGSLATEAEIQTAYHREAYLYHPDRFFGLNNAEVSSLAKKIYGRIVEAYTTLSNKEKREAYDRALSKGANTQSGSGPVVDEDKDTAVRKRTNVQSAPGMRFLKLAQSAFQTGDIASAKMNIQIAINSDPHDPDILHLSQRIEAEYIKRKGSGNSAANNKTKSNR